MIPSETIMIPLYVVEFGIFWRVVLPNLVLAMAILGVLTLQGQWHDPLSPLLVVQSEGMKTIRPLHRRVHRAEAFERGVAVTAPPSPACRCGSCSGRSRATPAAVRSCSPR